MFDPITCLAVAIYFEARGEFPIGQAAVAYVIMNRVESSRFPGDICAVIKQTRKPGTRRCQFSFWCDGKSDRPREPHAYMQAILIAVAVVDGEILDPTYNATHYHADYVDPSWGLSFTVTIGHHLFYKEI